MNMHGKDGCLVVLVLLATVIDVKGLYISLSSTTKVADDDTFMVVCLDEDGLPVTWKNSKGAVLGPKTRPKVEISSFGTSIIFNSPHKIEDTGDYTCSTSKDKRVFQLFVETPLKFKDTATNQTGEEGNPFLLKCEVKGGTVAWEADGGSTIKHNDKFEILADGLLIRNVTRHDSKTYICKGVQQRTGTMLDRKIHFNVRHKPVHPSHPQRHMRQDVVYGYINGFVNLTCVAVADPPAKFEWKATERRQKIGEIINESPQVSILQLHIANNSTFGNYKCIAKNQLGTYEENFTLKQGMKPVPPKEVQPKETRSKSIMFEIVGPERSPEMDLETEGFRLQYRKIDDKEWKQEDFNITKNNLYTLDNLDPNTEYEVQAATRNPAGVGDYLNPTRWKTTSGAATASLALTLGYLVSTLTFFRNFDSALW